MTSSASHTVNQARMLGNTALLPQHIADAPHGMKQVGLAGRLTLQCTPPASRRLNTSSGSARPGGKAASGPSGMRMLQGVVGNSSSSTALQVAKQQAGHR